MKSIVLAVLSMLAVSAAPFTQQESSPTGDEIRVKQLERAWAQAEARHDVNAVAAIVADTLVYTEYDGSFMNKSEYLRSVVKAQLEADHFYDQGISVQTYGNAAVAVGVFRETGTTKGKPYTRHARFTDTWIRQGSVWRCVASQSTLTQSK